MGCDEFGNMTYRRCYFLPFQDLPWAAQQEIEKGWWRPSAQGRWQKATSWAFAVNKKNKLIRCPYIEPVDNLEEYRNRLRKAGRIA